MAEIYTRDEVLGRYYEKFLKSSPCCSAGLEPG